MIWQTIIKIYIAAALVFAGTQFTHAGEIHDALGHFGHDDHHHHQSGSASIGDTHAADTPGNMENEPADASSGLHCGAPLLAVFGQDIVHVRTILHIRRVDPAEALLTVRFNLDPPPPRA